MHTYKFDEKKRWKKKKKASHGIQKMVDRFDGQDRLYLNYLERSLNSSVGVSERIASRRRRRTAVQYTRSAIGSQKCARLQSLAYLRWLIYMNIYMPQNPDATSIQIHIVLTVSSALYIYAAIAYAVFIYHRHEFHHRCFCFRFLGIHRLAFLMWQTCDKID